MYDISEKVFFSFIWKHGKPLVLSGTQAPFGQFMLLIFFFNFWQFIEFLAEIVGNFFDNVTETKKNILFNLGVNKPGTAKVGAISKARTARRF